MTKSTLTKLSNVTGGMGPCKTAVKDHERGRLGSLSVDAAPIGIAEPPMRAPRLGAAPGDISARCLRTTSLRVWQGGTWD